MVDGDPPIVTMLRWWATSGSCVFDDLSAPHWVVKGCCWVSVGVSSILVMNWVMEVCTVTGEQGERGEVETRKDETNFSNDAFFVDLTGLLVRSRVACTVTGNIYLLVIQNTLSSYEERCGREERATMDQMRATSRFHTLPVVCGLSPAAVVFACDPLEQSRQLLSGYTRIPVKASTGSLAQTLYMAVCMGSSRGLTITYLSLHNMCMQLLKDDDRHIIHPDKGFSARLRCRAPSCTTTESTPSPPTLAAFEPTTPTRREASATARGELAASAWRTTTEAAPTAEAVRLAVCLWRTLAAIRSRGLGRTVAGDDVEDATAPTSTPSSGVRRSSSVCVSTASSVRVRHDVNRTAAAATEPSVNSCEAGDEEMLTGRWPQA
jgi:hypothetical protein